MQKNTKPLSGRVALSARLEAIAALAGCGRTVCDVGCDHAHIPIRLLQTGSYENAIGMDVIDGPLGKAAGNLALYGMTDRVELRLSDGLDAFRAGEADTLVITGMGGTMMENILLREPRKTRSFKALVLGPQSDPDKVRAALRTLGFEIRNERLIYEDGKYYPVLRAERPEPPAKDSAFAGQAGDGMDRCAAGQAEDGMDRCASGQTKDGMDRCTARQAHDGENSAVAGRPDDPDELRREAEDLFGPVLLQRQDPVLYEFLSRQTKVLEKIHRSISEALVQREGEAAADLSARDREPDTGAAQPGDREPDTEAAQPGDREPDTRAAQLRDRHLARQREIEHSLRVFRAGLSRFS